MTDEMQNAGYAARLNALAGGANIARVLELYDSLPPLPVSDMIGRWRGTGLATGNPFDGMLERFGWYGKHFHDAENVDPLLFPGRNGGLIALNPAVLPMGLIAAYPRIVHNPVADAVFQVGKRLLGTNKPQARLRMTEYRGVVSATMIYDRQPINDVFRKVSADRLLGAMDIRGCDYPFMFILDKV